MVMHVSHVKDKMINYFDYLEIKHRVWNYINVECILRNNYIPAKVPGQYYTWMFYLRRGLFNTNFLEDVSNLFLYDIHKELGNFEFQVTGLETASTPMLTGISLVAKKYEIEINAFSVRKDRKEYGLYNWIEGIPNEKPAIILDDLCNSSFSMGKAYQILKEQNIPTLDYAFCLVNKVNKGIHDSSRETHDMYLPNNVKVLSLFTLDDFGLTDPSH